MRSRACMPIVLAIVVLALPSTTASAERPAPGSAVAELGPKNYAKNSAGGDYGGARAEAEFALIKRGLVLNRAAQAGELTGAAQAPSPTAGDGFAWEDAALGAGVALALGALVAIGLAARRRMTAEPVRGS